MDLFSRRIDPIWGLNPLFTLNTKMKDILPNISGGNIYIYIYIYPVTKRIFFLISVTKRHITLTLDWKENILLWEMLTDVLWTIVNNLFKESFYGKKMIFWQIFSFPIKSYVKIFLKLICRDKGPESCIGPWVLSKNV